MKRCRQAPPDAFVAALSNMMCCTYVPYHPFYASLTKRLANCKRDNPDKQPKLPRRNHCCASKMQNLQCNSRTHAHTHTHTGDRTLLMIPLSGPQSHANILIQSQIFGVLWSIAGVSCWPVQLMQCREDTENISLCLFAVSDVLPGFLIRMPKPSRAGTDCVSFLRMG